MSSLECQESCCCITGSPLNLELPACVLHAVPQCAIQCPLSAAGFRFVSSAAVASFPVLCSVHYIVQCSVALHCARRNQSKTVCLFSPCSALMCNVYHGARQTILCPARGVALSSQKSSTQSYLNLHHTAACTMYIGTMPTTKRKAELMLTILCLLLCKVISRHERMMSTF